ncbi:triphosphoribosyl-dephospho-CoA synthase MdcB [Bosea caraganae]|uniref:Probable 2-(5''-triphosphoribosyl)-3'-dephosphocoenzyme-A synthase n=1 Tax=Bosea caraganae TaxID=2763117 RepID=A0A370L9T6_9HYPH|nr:triphosphoribosyl-dephospho-CoA synthase MdcB [Bosea caraganae]RDJ22081.1 triphosphoribosyl-dephospho-CoA synthase MdcB [Bosea caraganae]RDJ28094.1 triphosphoribosyl-dephospho-CoA synthase MdcB [Bosea caraganae]
MTAARALDARQAHPSQARAPRSLDLGAIAASAVDCLLLEVGTWPKPGLVSHVDSGSHDDMDAGTFRASAAAIAPYLHALVEAGADGCAMGRLRVIGLEAEAAMLAATAGINTHRGAIFGLGLLCAAAGARASGRVAPSLPLGAVVSRLWGRDILGGPVLLHSHGDAARRRFGAGGARLQAARGFPSVYEVGLPALRRGALAAPGNAEAARVEACFALIAALEDTNLLHRGGLAGLRFARRAAQNFLDAGGVGQRDWLAHARAIHAAFIARRLSPGGAADLLAMTLFVAAQERTSP